MSYNREIEEDSYVYDESLLDLVMEFTSGEYEGTLPELFHTAFGLIDGDCNLDETDSKGNTAIFYVIECRTLWTVLPRLAQKCDINVVNNEGFTPLHIAAQQVSTFPTNVLYQNNARIFPDVRGYYPVDIARNYNNDNVVNFY